MKKRIILILIILILTCACSKSINSTNLKNLNNMLDNKETFILYLTDNEGTTLKNTISKIVNEKNIKAYYLDTSKLNDNDLASLKEKFMFEETNIIIFVKNGVEETTLSRIDNLYISQDKLEQEFKNQGYIK